MVKFNEVEIIGDRVSLENPEPKPKKLTATRAAAIFGVNPWKTPFQAWCEICRVAEPPFEETKFTAFGKIVEQKMHNFCLEYISPHLQRPVDVYGARTQYTYDYYPHPILGGMWDARVLNRKGDVIGIVEYKTSSRPQDWIDGPPPYYQIQAFQYAYLECVDDYWIVCTFPNRNDRDESLDDYSNPESYVVTDENTRIWHFKVSDGYGNNTEESVFESLLAWWVNHVETGISPKFDKKKDKEYLDIMRTSVVELPDSLEALSKQVAMLSDKLEQAKIRAGIPDLEKEIKKLTDEGFKVALREACEEGKTIIETNEWKYAQAAETTEIDKKAMEADGVLEKYTITKPGSWRLTRKKDYNGRN